MARVPYALGAEIDPGLLLRVFVPRQTLCCEWAKARHTGCSVTNTKASAPMIWQGAGNMSDDIESPRAKRSSVILKALVRCVAVPSGVERRVRNLSASGACIDHAGELGIGDALVLVMGEVPDLAAHVAWTTERLAGVRFEREIDLDAAKAHRTAAPVLRSGWMADMNHAYRTAG